MQSPGVAPDLDSAAACSSHPPDSILRLPAEMRALIESVAEKVAQKGSTYELQLRMRDKQINKLPFLYLDHPLAPYYQWKLIEARGRLRSASPEMVAGDSVDGLRSEHGPLSSPASQFEDGHRHFTPQEQDQAWLVDLLSNATDRSSRYGYPIGLTSQQDTETVLPKYHYPDPITSNPHMAGNETTENDRSSTAIEDDEILAAQAQSSPNGLVYMINQEVHLLDSAGNEPSGLTTYVVVDNSEGRFCEAAEKFTEAMADETLNEHRDHESREKVIYTVVPCTSTKFRTVHSRLLPVGFALGAEVQQLDNYAASIVIRRTVKNGRRFYDLRDEFADEHKDVAEDDLTPHTGGLFQFRVPNMM